MTEMWCLSGELYPVKIQITTCHWETPLQLPASRPGVAARKRGVRNIVFCPVHFFFCLLHFHFLLFKAFSHKCHANNTCQQVAPIMHFLSFWLFFFVFSLSFFFLSFVFPLYPPADMWIALLLNTFRFLQFHHKDVI